jgi:hypothetical protein
MRLFKVAAGDRTLKSGHPKASRRDFFVDFFSGFIYGGVFPGAPPGIISGTSGHLGRNTDLP